MRRQSRGGNEEANDVANEVAGKMDQARSEMRSGARRSQGRWWFLGAVTLAWLVLALLRPELLAPAWSRFAGLLLEVLPALVLVFLFLLIANLFSEKPWIERHMGREGGKRGWFIALGAGVLAAGPPWPWYALAGQMMRRGVRPGLAAAFLYARAIKLPMLPLLIHYFGLAYSLVLSFWLLVFAFLGGLAMQRLMPENRHWDTDLHQGTSTP